MTINNRSIETLRNGLSRIFAMKVTKSTFREIQNLIFAITEGEESAADALLQAIAGADFDDSFFSEDAIERASALARDYAIPVRLSKEVLERGEFLNLLTSDTVGSNKGPLLLNRIRRTDGEEFQFVTDATSTVNILQHFTGRMNELAKTEEGKKNLKEVKRGLENTQMLLSELLKT